MPRPTHAKTYYCGTTFEPFRPLINPFRPEEFITRITANRRRWIHVFPVDKQGKSKLAHHFVQGKSIMDYVQQAEEAVSYLFSCRFFCKPSEFYDFLINSVEANQRVLISVAEKSSSKRFLR